MAEIPGGSRNSLNEANRDRSEFSRYGGLGAAGFISPYDSQQAGKFLSKPGDVSIVNRAGDVLADFEIAVAWDNVVVEKEVSFFKRFFKKKVLQSGVDIDLGCLYQLKNGKRGAMQAFGEEHGAYDAPPYIFLSGDERRGDRKGPDETILVNGTHWDEIDRILIYVYIYGGVDNWDAVKPQIQVRVPGEEPKVVTLNARKNEMALCAVAKLTNIRGGIRMTSLMEYFPGHAELDRAFGYGLEWESGQKE
jgi:tellurite resistance protein TerA